MHLFAEGNQQGTHIILISSVPKSTKVTGIFFKGSSFKYIKVEHRWKKHGRKNKVVRNFDRSVCIATNYGDFKWWLKLAFTKTNTWTTTYSCLTIQLWSENWFRKLNAKGGHGTYSKCCTGEFSRWFYDFIDRHVITFQKMSRNSWIKGQRRCWKHLRKHI